MLTIWKYHVEPDRVHQLIEMPRGAEILSFGIDPGGALCFWALVETENEKEDHIVMCVGTGWDVIGEARFIGTVVRGAYVYHGFDCGRKSG